jgi:hypothetical protein
MGCFLDEEFQVLQKLEQPVWPVPLLPEPLALPVQPELWAQLLVPQLPPLVPLEQEQQIRPELHWWFRLLLRRPF